MDEYCLYGIVGKSSHPVHGSLEYPSAGVVQLGEGIGMIPLSEDLLNAFERAESSLAGGPLRGNAYILDGVAMSDIRNRAVVSPNLEAIEEMKIQISTYDAEMGRTGGGVRRLHGLLLRDGLQER